MAFFDDDPPTQQRRSPGPPPPPRTPRGPRRPLDHQEIVRNRAIVIGVFVLFVLIIAVVLKGCVDTARTNGLKNYNQKVNEIGTQSISNVASALQILAAKDSSDALSQRQSLDELAADSAKLTQQARDLDTPGSLTAATWNLATALSLRATAISRTADLIGKARGTSKAEQETATGQIAGQMEALLASDVLWQTRVSPFIKEQFAADSQNTSSISSSTVMKDLGWLNTATVATRIGGFSEVDDTTTPLAPGPHGHALSAVEANGKTLVAGAVTTVPAGSGVSFTVTIENQGDSDESDVSVNVSGVKQAGGSKVFDQTKKVNLSKKGAQTQVEIPITKSVTSAVTVTVEVRKVRGESNTTNNKGTYQVIFS